MLAGVPPFGGPTAQAIMVRHAVDPVPSLRTVRPTVAAELEGVVMKALAKVPADRFPQMAALLASLQAIAAPAAAPGAAVPSAPASGTPAIAVLPFTNMSADPDQEYFCDGMAEEILGALGRVGGLRVIARTASFSFKGTQSDVRDIGRSLNVDMILQGSVRKAGRRLRITAELVKVPEGVHLWSERYDREMEDIFAVQDDISRSIITALRVKLGMEQAAPLVKRPTANLQAYDAYLRGIHSFNKRSQQANAKAIDLLERATTLDPDFALGFAALAGAYIEHFFTHEPDEEWEEKAFVAIEKARTLDPELAEIYVAKGNLLWTRAHHFLHREAITEYRRALAISPDLAEAHNELARVYWHIGQLDAAYEALERAMEIDPAFVDGKFRLAWLEMHRGNYPRALSLFEGVPKQSLAPSVDALTALTLHYLGRGAEGRARLDEVPDRYRHRCDFTSVKAIFLALDGDAQAAEDTTQLALTDGQDLGHFHHVTNNVAVAYAVMNDKTSAMQWLERTADDGFPCHPWFERDPCLANLRGDARFEAFLSRLKNQWPVPGLGL
jgi:TolB-like protein/Tfp pilus assembly protein PilF